MTDTAVLRFLSGFAALCVEHGYAAAFNLSQQLLRLVNAVIYTGENDGFAVKTGGFDIFVRRNDNAVTCGNLGGGEHIFCPTGAVCFYLTGNSELFAGFIECLCRHVGVGNAGGTGCDRQHTVAGRDAGVLFCDTFVTKLRLFLRVNYREKLFWSFGGVQFCHEIFIHQHLHHAGQQIHVQVAIVWRGNHKKQAAFFRVIWVILHRRFRTQGRKAWLCHASAFCVGHCDAAVHISGSLSLTGIDGLFVGRHVRDATVGNLQRNQLVNDLRLIFHGEIQRNGFGAEKVCDTHG